MKTCGSTKQKEEDEEDEKDEETWNDLKSAAVTRQRAELALDEQDTPVESKQQTDQSMRPDVSNERLQERRRPTRESTCK